MALMLALGSLFSILGKGVSEMRPSSRQVST